MDIDELGNDSSTHESPLTANAPSHAPGHAPGQALGEALGEAPLETNGTDEPGPSALEVSEAPLDEPSEDLSTPLVAIVAHDDALIDDLIETVQAEGCRAIGSKLLGVHGEHVDVERLFAEHNPAVVVFDVVQPYADYVSILRKLEALPDSKGRQFIVTATDNAALKALGVNDAVALREPEDIALVADAVESALQRIDA